MRKYFLCAVLTFALCCLPAAAQTSSTTTGKTGQAPAGKATTPAAKTAPADKKSAEKIDINSASKAELASLPGIGDVTSQKIIGGRPYKTKRDLLTKKIVTQSQYDKITDQIIAKQATGKSTTAAPASGTGKK